MAIQGGRVLQYLISRSQYNGSQSTLVPRSLSTF